MTAMWDYINSQWNQQCRNELQVVIVGGSGHEKEDVEEQQQQDTVVEVVAEGEWVLAADGDGFPSPPPPGGYKMQLLFAGRSLPEVEEWTPAQMEQWLKLVFA
jgi:hypothetical protein